MTEVRHEVRLSEAERTSIRIRMVRMSERGAAPFGPLADLRRCSVADLRRVVADAGEHAALAAAELDARAVVARVFRRESEQREP